MQRGPGHETQMCAHSHVHTRNLHTRVGTRTHARMCTRRLPGRTRLPGATWGVNGLMQPQAEPARRT